MRCQAGNKLAIEALQGERSLKQEGQEQSVGYRGKRDEAFKEKNQMEQEGSKSYGICPCRGNHSRSSNGYEHLCISVSTVHTADDSQGIQQSISILIMRLR